ncbi:wound-responsive family protein [Arabidopsis thaliana]|uniref:Wound-responsive family protein n=1 Tax=Arabidopsis thaliana TaxID=3702 RepID=F4HY28_ARATH|nr:wound-responsive family protein [Arabidopsis thaliana]AEE30126.1 wound-responsive family protein [Arabidopsis thaliana]|eukprot:NP_001185055.1 wound-responsive family protein [Arabidopsis thaliana]
MSEVNEMSGGSIGGELLRASPKVLTAGDRKLLKVELRPGDTTYVSWKKLMRDAGKVNGLSASVPDPPPNANPNLEFRIAPGHPVEIETNEQPHSNRFNAVIEKIERLYKGNDSSDGEELDGAPDDDEYDTEDSFIDDAELDEYFEVDNSTVKHDGFYVNRGKLERMEPSTTSNQQPKKRRRKDSAKPCRDAVDVSDKHTKLSITARKKDQSTAPGSWKTQESPLPSGAQDANTSVPLDDVKHSDRANHQSRNDTSHKSRETGSSSALHQKYSNKSLHQQSTSLLGKSPPNVFAEVTVVRQKENNGMHQLANVTGSRQSSQASKKDGSNVKSKTSILEKAIRELEKVVVESRPPAITENQEADTSSQAVKRRLPRDVKLKLAKVARIAQASQGKHSTELINRLMSIVGHLIQLRSLKRNLKIMIDMGDSATREKDTRFKQINNEVLDMIKAKVSLMESQAIKPEGATSDDFQDSVEKPSLKKFVMDAALEDKLCDLYDIFIDGLDEDQGPQTKKLYVNLAELWPNRLMDYRGIKHAIFRAKERRKALYGNLAKEMVDQTKMKKSMKQLVPRTDCTAQPNTELVVQRQHSGEKKLIVDPNATSTSVVTSQTMVDRSNQQQPEKLKGISSSCNPTEETRVVKRKNEAVMAEKQVVLALKKPEHPQTRVIPAPQNLNIPRTTPDLNLPS